MRKMVPITQHFHLRTWNKTRPLKLLQRGIMTSAAEQLHARETIYFNKRLAFIEQLPLFL